MAPHISWCGLNATLDSILPFRELSLFSGQQSWGLRRLSDFSTSLEHQSILKVHLLFGIETELEILPPGAVG